ncbi:hypothetical protein HDV00_001796 [Rhizophlyctis rosea]|nr:hypothetical protein HDV00_001796 [Rhizophlyctis rosea]
MRSTITIIALTLLALITPTLAQTDNQIYPPPSFLGLRQQQPETYNAQTTDPNTPSPQSHSQPIKIRGIHNTQHRHHRKASGSVGDRVKRAVKGGEKVLEDIGTFGERMGERVQERVKRGFAGVRDEL